MSSAQLANEAVEAFNDVQHLSGDEVDALQRAEWVLRKLFLRNRSNSVAALGLLHACEMLGRRDDAVVLADELWGRRSGLAPEDRLTFSVLAGSIGRYDWAADLADLPDAMLSDAQREQKATSIAQVLVSTWDPQLFRRFGQPTSAAFTAFAAEAQEIGLLGRLEERQRLINAIVADVQCGSHTSIGTDGDSRTIQTRIIYASGEKCQRDELALRALDAEEAFYREHSIPLNDARWLIGEVILPPEARGPVAEHVA